METRIAATVDYQGRHTVWILRGLELIQYDPHTQKYHDCPPVPPIQRWNRDVRNIPTG